VDVHENEGYLLLKSFTKSRARTARRLFFEIIAERDQAFGKGNSRRCWRRMELSRKKRGKKKREPVTTPLL